MGKNNSVFNNCDPIGDLLKKALDITQLLKNEKWYAISGLIREGRFTPTEVVKEYYNARFNDEKDMNSSYLMFGIFENDAYDEIAKIIIEIGDFEFASAFLYYLHSNSFCLPGISVDRIVLLCKMYLDSDELTDASQYSNVFNYFFRNNDTFGCALKEVVKTDSVKLILSFVRYAISCAGEDFELKSEDIELLADKLIEVETTNIDGICRLVENLRYSKHVIGEIGPIRDKLAKYVIDKGNATHIYKVAKSLQGLQNDLMDELVQAIINLDDFNHLCLFIEFKIKVNQLFVAIVKLLGIETFPAEKIENILNKLAEAKLFDINLLVDFLVYWGQQMAKGIDIFQEPISLEDDSIGGRQFVKEQVNPKGV